ncbi:MAG: hypothetical protein L6W00_26375 [Lentisphaeria bacterium]|nr:MAG: hypothetical protein L6W00_26375 [Lentisphaeria bacterium]
MSKIRFTPRGSPVFPFPRFYNLGNDYWSVRVSGDYAFCADTHNGFFVLNIADPAKPFCIGHARLEEVLEPKRYDAHGKQLPDSRLADAVSSLAVGNGVVYRPESRRASISRNCRASPSRGRKRRFRRQRRFRRNFRNRRDSPVFVRREWSARRPFPALSPFWQLQTTAFTVFGSVNGKSPRCNTIRNASPSTQRSAATPCMWRKILMDSAFTKFKTTAFSSGRQPFPCRGTGAVSRSGRRKEAIWSSYRTTADRFSFWMFPTRKKAKEVFRHNQVGIIYSDLMTQQLIGGRYLFFNWHHSGYAWYDLSGEKPVPANWKRFRFASHLDGAASLGTRCLAVANGGYYLLEANQGGLPADWQRVSLPGVKLGGIPSVDGDTLVLSSRRTGEITVLDIRDPLRPRLDKERSLTVPGLPGTVSFFRHRMVIPAGYAGLYLEQSRENRETVSR